MTKVTYVNTMNFVFDESHRGAKYNINGKWANRGEWLESVAKHHRGLSYVVNPNTSWDNGSDIESECLSIKSSGASLASIYGDNFDEILKTFINGVFSTEFAFITNIDDMIIEYHMNLNEFVEFVTVYGRLVRPSSQVKTDLYKIRLIKESKKMLGWLEERVA